MYENINPGEYPVTDYAVETQEEYWVYDLPQVRSVLQPDSHIGNIYDQVDQLNGRLKTGAGIDNDETRAMLTKHRDYVRNMLEDVCRQGFPNLVPETPPEG